MRTAIAQSCTFDLTTTALATLVFISALRRRRDDREERKYDDGSDRDDNKTAKTTNMGSGAGAAAGPLDGVVVQHLKDGGVWVKVCEVPQVQEKPSHGKVRRLRFTEHVEEALARVLRSQATCVESAR